MRLLGLSLALALGSGAAAGCYSTGDGTSPPPKQLYFPVGLAVSAGGNVLYVANSDFDLQYNGGTLQSYDLHLIRKHAAIAIVDPNDPNLPLARPASGVSCNGATQDPPTYRTDQSGQRQPLGETCAPPVDSSVYVRDSVTIGAFATDLQLAVPRGPRCVADPAPAHYAACDELLACPDQQHCELTAGNDRLFAPVRGDGSLTWAQVTVDDPGMAPPEKTWEGYAPFVLDCGVRSSGRCDAAHLAGTDPNEPNNTRHLTMPGEPFAMAQSQDGQSIAVTHQSTTTTSLFYTGMPGPGQDQRILQPPSLQFVLDGLPGGGDGIASVPHDAQAFASSTQRPNVAFLQTSNASTELDLLRYYGDQGSSLARPFIVKEAAYGLSANAGGSDSRGVLFDPSARLACKARLAPLPASPTPAQLAQRAADLQACARLPARVFIANRSPASLIVGEIGEASPAGDGVYDADRLVIFGSVPLSVGPSKLYLAPIVDAEGNYALRVFAVCFDSATVYVYDPELGVVENIIRTGPGPFAMTFDRFDLADAAARRPVPMDPREPGLGLRAYRFAYIASFTQSYIQLLDLDDARVTGGAAPTFEDIVYTLGQPTIPKGSQ